MRAELKALVYERLKLSSDYSQKDIANIGWKARKYIRWEQIHVNPEEDRLLLKVFADEAINNSRLLLHAFGRVNEILLRVEKWRLEKDGKVGEPKKTKFWIELNDTVRIVNESPSYLYTLLNGYSSKLKSIREVNLEGVLSNYLLGRFVSKSLCIESDFKVEDLLTKNFGDFLKLSLDVNKFPEEFSVFFEKDIPCVFEALGIPMLKIDSTKLKLGEENSSGKEPLVVQYESMDTEFLYCIRKVNEESVIILNHDNKFISNIKGNTELEVMFCQYFLEFHSVLQLMPRDSDTIESFSKYLSVRLHSASSNIKN
jgi:hypothetical protein